MPACPASLQLGEDDQYDHEHYRERQQHDAVHFAVLALVRFGLLQLAQPVADPHLGRLDVVVDPVQYRALLLDQLRDVLEDDVQVGDRVGHAQHLVLPALQQLGVVRLDQHDLLLVDREAGRGQLEEIIQLVLLVVVASKELQLITNNLPKNI